MKEPRRTQTPNLPSAARRPWGPWGPCLGKAFVEPLGEARKRAPLLDGFEVLRICLFYFCWVFVFGKSPSEVLFLSEVHFLGFPKPRQNNEDSKAYALSADSALTSKGVLWGNRHHLGARQVEGHIPDDIGLWCSGILGLVCPMSPPSLP